MLPVHIRQGLVRAAPRAGVRKVHRSTKRLADGSSSGASNDSSATSNQNNAPPASGESFSLNELFKNLSSKPTQAAAAAPNPAEKAVLMEEFFKNIRKDTQDVATNSAKPAQASADQVTNVTELLKMLGPMAQNNQPSSSRRSNASRSPSELFDTLFPKNLAESDGQPSIRPGTDSLTKVFDTHLSSGRKRPEDFGHWTLFPRQIQKWIIYTRTQPGYYSDSGQWVPSVSSSPILPQKTELQRKEESVQNVEKYEEEQRMLPEDLRGQFRYGITPTEASNLHPKLRRVLSLKNAHGSEINAFRVRKYVEEFGYHVADTGNSAVQVAILTLRINNLLERCKKHVTDRHNKFRLNILIQRRKGLLKHLKKRNLDLYYKTLKTIKLKDGVEIYATKLM